MRRILSPIPVRIWMSASFVRKQREGAKLVRLQWSQSYSLRTFYVPIIKIDPRLRSGDVAVLEIWEERREWISEERGIRAPEGMTRTIIKLYKPIKPDTVPRAVFVAVEYPLRSTRMGGYDDAELITGSGVLWHYVTSNVSKSGRHGKKLFLVVSREPIKIRWVSVSNRGNRRAGIDLYGFDEVKTLPEMEELKVVKSWSYGRAVKMRNNITGEIFTALILEFHRARKTPAMTDHVIEPEDAVELIESDAHGSKTHWTEIYKVIKPCRIKTIRVTNCGNRYEESVEVAP